MVKELKDGDLFSDCQNVLRTMDTPISEYDVELVNQLVINILRRWHSESETDSKFKKVYQARYGNAKGAVLAIVELVQAVGKGDKMPKRYKGLLH